MVVRWAIEVNTQLMRLDAKIESSILYVRSPRDGCGASASKVLEISRKLVTAKRSIICNDITSRLMTTVSEVDTGESP